MGTAIQGSLSLFMQGACMAAYIIVDRLLRKLFFFVLIPLIIISMPSAGPCDDLRGIAVVPDTEKRSCIQAVDGYAYLSENMTLSQTRAAAFATAKRQALEMAKTYIESKSKLEDFELTYDLVWATAEGSVTVLEQKDHGVEDNTRYHVWIKAEVAYDMSPKDGAVSPPQSIDGQGPLTVRVWTPKKVYGQGENIEVFVLGNRDFYARIVDITSSGDIIQLLPNAYRNSAFFSGGKTYKIPDVGDRFDLRVSPPYGQDQIVVYASEVPLGSVDMVALGNQGLSLYQGSRDGLAGKTRGISVVASDPKARPGVEFYEAAWTVSTRP